MYNCCRTSIVRRRRKSINIENAIINIAGKAWIWVCCAYVFVSPLLCTWYYARRAVVVFRKENNRKPDTHTERKRPIRSERIYSVKGLFLVKNVDISLNIIYHHCVDREKKLCFWVNGLLCAWYIWWMKKAIEPIKLNSRKTINHADMWLVCCANLSII